jgi:hypothetical protein
MKTQPSHSSRPQGEPNPSPAPTPGRTSFWQRFLRHAGSVAVDHTHLLPLETLERQLARERQPCC